ncbi:MAG: ParB/RepB/Spo0J family partition protein [Planctomycetia bacterium]|nr:ParB/RepB/Spo0J family partition protein [Planctomycetia bacterium]
MSKDKKLGRGLQDLLEQQKNASLKAQQNVSSENKEQNTHKKAQEEIAAEKQPKDGDIELKESVADQKLEQNKNNTAQDKKDREETRNESTLSIKEKEEEKSLENTESEADTEFFHTIRKEVEEAKKDVEGLQEEISSVSTLRNTSENAGNETAKTLMDYMNDNKNEDVEDSASDRKVNVQKATNVQVLTVYDENGDDTDRIYNISVSLIDSNPWQPRRVFQGSEITELAESLKMHGLLQPIVLREFRNRYQLVAGERRLRAALKLNWTQVPATIIDATDREMAELALIENVQRKDLNPIEKALSFDKYLQENHCTQEELAKRLNLDRSTISNLIRLLMLPAEIQDLVVEEKITQGHARSLLALASTQDQIAMADRIEEEKLSVRQTEQIVAEWNQKPVAERRTGNIAEVPVSKTQRAKKTKSAHVMDMERQLQEALDLKVKISADDKGKGKLEIYFQNQEDFTSLMDYFRN